jgi:hypothetical protein
VSCGPQRVTSPPAPRLCRLEKWRSFRVETQALQDRLYESPGVPVLEECRALIKQIVADLSGEKPFADETSATELVSYLERAASALKKSVSRS